jgi:hypothetical protein
VSYSNDDSFEWFGGAINATHLVAYHGWDDDFDSDNGFSGLLQFLLGVRNPKIGDTSLSNGFESDNDADGDDKTPYTTAQFCNVTLVGPANTPGFINEAGAGKYIDAGTLDPNNGSKVGQFQSGVQIRRNSRLSLSNALITGYPVGLIVENDKSVKNTQSAADARQAIKNTIFGGYTNNAAGAQYNNTATAVSVLGSDKNKTWTDVYSADAAATDDSQTSFSHRHILNAAGNNALSTVAQLGLNSNYAPASGSVLLNAAFTVPAGFNASGNGFAGAFKSDAAADNWLAGWTNFDPQNATY